MKNAQTKKKKKSSGRPPKYSPEILKKAEEYLNLCKDKEERVIESFAEKSGYEKYREKVTVKFPNQGGLANYIGVARETLHAWRLAHKPFSDIMERLMAEQEDRLLNKGLSGEYNSRITKLVLSKHGYHEKVENDVNLKSHGLEDIESLSDEELARLYKETA